MSKFNWTLQVDAGLVVRLKVLAALHCEPAEALTSRERDEGTVGLKSSTDWEGVLVMLMEREIYHVIIICLPELDWRLSLYGKTIWTSWVSHSPCKQCHVHVKAMIYCSLCLSLWLRKSSVWLPYSSASDYDHLACHCYAGACELPFHQNNGLWTDT